MVKDFHSPFLSARAVRRAPDSIPPALPPQRPLDASGLIPWTEFVDAVWDLPREMMLTGELPMGVSSQQFWAKVMRAAGRRGGKVGVAVRGERFWVWSREAPQGRAEAEEDGVGRVANRKRGWVGELMLKLRSGEPVRVERVLSVREKEKVRE